MVGGEDAVTRSFCGTEQYMSPEMLLQQVACSWSCVKIK